MIDLKKQRMVVPCTRLLLFILFSKGFLSASAQIGPPKYEIGIKAGAFVYQGDLAPSDAGSFKTLRPQFGIFASRLLSPSFAVRLNFDAGSINGDDAKYSHPSYRQQRNFRFSSPVYELSALLVWDVLGKNYNRSAKSFSPYVLAGVGYSFINVQRDWSRMNPTYFNPESGVPAELVVDAATSPDHGVLVFPMGIGLRYALTEKVSFIGESSFRFMSTDYLDGFSLSANPSRSDHYYSISLGAVYTFGKKNNWDCPAMKY